MRIIKMTLSVMLFLFIAFQSYAEEIITRPLSDVFQLSEGTIVGWKIDHDSTFDTVWKTRYSQMKEWKKATSIDVPEDAYGLFTYSPTRVQVDYYTRGDGLRWWGYDSFTIDETTGEQTRSITARFENGTSIMVLPENITTDEVYTQSGTLSIMYAETLDEEQEELKKAFSTEYIISTTPSRKETNIGVLEGTYFISGKNINDGETTVFSTFFHPKAGWVDYGSCHITTEMGFLKTEGIYGAIVDENVYPQGSARGLVDLKTFFMSTGTSNVVYASLFGDQVADIYFIFMDTNNTVRSLTSSGMVEGKIVPYVQSFDIKEVMKSRPFFINVGSFTSDATWGEGWHTLYMIVAEPGKLTEGKIYSIDTATFSIYKSASTN